MFGLAGLGAPKVHGPHLRGGAVPTACTKSARTTPAGGGCVWCTISAPSCVTSTGGGCVGCTKSARTTPTGGGCVCCTKSAPLTLTSTGGGCATGFSETRLHQKCTRKILHLRGGAVPTGCTKSARTTPTGGGCSWCTKSARSDAHISGGGL